MRENATHRALYHEIHVTFPLPAAVRTNAAQLPLHLNAPSDNAANRLYERDAFVQIRSAALDLYSVRWPNLKQESSITRKVQIGGLTKQELLDRLTAASVQLNDHARTLFAHEQFTTLPEVAVIDIAELTVVDLGFPAGATITEIHQRAAERGLAVCPLELAAQLRLQYLDQPEGALGQPTTLHRAPPGSLTVASRELTTDEDVPKGFYLRRINGTLWLRGYCSGAEHVWSAEDRMVFIPR